MDNSIGKYQLHSITSGELFVIDTITGETKMISHGNGMDSTTDGDGAQLGLAFADMEKSIKKRFF